MCVCVVARQLVMISVAARSRFRREVPESNPTILVRSVVVMVMVVIIASGFQDQPTCYLGVKGQQARSLLRGDNLL